jgi:hypothetical protein
MKRHIGFIQSFAKGGNISSIEKRVAEVNSMIKEATEKNIEVVDTSGTWQSPMKYEPLLYKNGILYIKYKELDLYHHNRSGVRNWELKSEKIGKHNTDYGVGEKEGSSQKKALTDIARMYRTALYHYNKYGYYAAGGELGKNGFTMREMREHLNAEFPDSFSFKVFPIKERTNNQPDYDAEIVKGRTLYGLEDSDIKGKLYFPQYKRDHEINYDIHQGGENTYFDFLLEDAEGTYYAGTFGFKDRGDVSPDYITRFLVFLQSSYGLPFEIAHEVMAKGGKVKDEPVIRQYFEDEAFEYSHGGTADSRFNSIFTNYLAAALWSSNDEDDEPLDANYSIYDFADETLKKMREDVKKFITENDEAIKASGMSDEQLGHDLWLTRNGHGAGFWDRGYDEEVGERLTDAARELGSTDLYVGDNGEIYAEGSYSDGGWMETTDVNARIKKDYEDEIGSLKRQIDYCNVRMGETSEAWIQKEYRATINGCRERIDEIEKTLHNIAHMAAGGTFEQGVKAIEKKLTGSKVAAKYQSLYGKKYDKKEAHVAATKIKGSMRALELAKKHKNKK